MATTRGNIALEQLTRLYGKRKLTPRNLPGTIQFLVGVYRPERVDLEDITIFVGKLNEICQELYGGIEKK